jgi:hypothetical protein
VDIHRSYKILGLHPGARKEEVHEAYRDLVQVWHPDRFAHNDRLQQKAQRNLKRINEAYQVLRDFDPPPSGVGRPSLLSATFSAIYDLGDMLQSGVMERPQVRRRKRSRDIVLGVGDVERTGSVRVPKKRSLGSLVAVAVLVFVIVVSVVALSLYLQ